MSKTWGRARFWNVYGLILRRRIYFSAAFSDVAPSSRGVIETTT